MKKIIVVFLSFLSVDAFGASTDSLNIGLLQSEVRNLKSTISRLQQEDGRLKDMYLQQTNELDSLKKVQQRQAEDVRMLADKVGADISIANQKIDDNVAQV